MEKVIADLYEVIKGRKEGADEKSYTSYLFNKGLDKILKKLGEECTEVIISAKNENKEEQVVNNEPEEEKTIVEEDQKIEEKTCVNINVIEV